MKAQKWLCIKCNIQSNCLNLDLGRQQEAEHSGRGLHIKSVPPGIVASTTTTRKKKLIRLYFFFCRYILAPFQSPLLANIDKAFTFHTERRYLGWGGGVEEDDHVSRCGIGTGSRAWLSFNETKIPEKYEKKKKVYRQQIMLSSLQTCASALKW